MRKLTTIIILILTCFKIQAQLERPDVFLSPLEMTASATDAGGSFAWFDQTNSSLTQTITIPTTGIYRVDISVKNVIAAPNLAIKIDGSTVLNLVPAGGTSAPIKIISGMTSSIAAGSHTLVIQLTNFSFPNNYLYVGLIYLTRTAVTAPYVYPALFPKTLPSGILTKEDFGGGKLRGFSLGSNGTNQIGETIASMTAMKATGANIARCFVEIERLSGDTYTFKANELTKLATTVSRGATLGYYVVPVMYHDPSLNSDYWGTSASHIARRASIVSLWQTLATTYSGNTTVAAYDLINEPRSNSNYAEVIRWQTDMINAIRAIDASHVLAVECISNDMFAMMLPLGYSNIIYSPHGYSTLKITHQGVAGEPSSNIRDAYPLAVSTANLTAPWGKTQLSAQHDDVRIMANRFHVPVFIGEFSCVNWAPASTTAGKWTSTEWVNDNISLLEAEGWSWVYHNWARGGEAIEWDPEIPSSFYNAISFTNARPNTIATSAAESPTAPTIVMLEGWFRLNTLGTKNYYFSSTGNDGNTGTSPASPWKSIAKLNTNWAVLNPGDSVLFKRGDTFNGSIIANKSGSASLPIVLGAYGSGADPIITSMAPMTSWTNIGSNVWTSTNALLGATVTVVTRNKGLLQLGRYPDADATNGGYLTYESHSGTTSITDNELINVPNWTGAEMVVRTTHFTTEIKTIASQSAGTLTGSVPFQVTPEDNSGYFIQKDVRTVTKEGEWFYDPSTKKIYLKSATTPTNVEASTGTDLISSANVSYIKIRNIAFKGANDRAVYISGGSGFDIQNCTFQYAQRAVFSSSHNSLVFKFNTLSNMLEDGIVVSNGSGHIVSDNNVDSSAQWVGMGGTGLDFGFYGIKVIGDNSLVERNTITNTGYCAIRFNSTNGKVRYNFINGFCNKENDGGGIYSGAISPLDVGQVISDNIIINGIGALAGKPGTQTFAFGIYIDNNNSNNLVTGNTVGNTYGGIYLHRGNHNTVTNNTVYNSSNTQFYINADNTTELVRSDVITNNIFFGKNASQNLAHTRFSDSLYNIGSMNSNAYATPSTATPYWLQVAGKGHYDLAGWRTNSGHDALSTEKNFLSTDSILFIYNATASTVKQSVGAWSYKDALNASYSDSVTLLPYASKVLIRGPAARPLPGVNITAPANGATYTAPATVSITATASVSGATITRVDFYAGAVKIGSDATSPYTFNWTSVGVGSYPLTARAFTSLGDSATSTSHTITVSAANIPPTVSITLPADSAKFNYPDSVQITASAADADGTISSVKFYSGNTLLKIETLAPYDFKHLFPVGNYTIYAVAFDNNGDSSISQPITVLVVDSIPALQIIIDSYNVLCNGGTGQITVYGQGGLPFSNGYIGIKDTVAHAGTYQFIITDSAGVSDTGSVTITEPSVLSASSSVGTIAVYLGSTTAQINVTGGTAPYNYLVNGRVTASTFSVTAGSYVVTITDANGCTSSTSFSVTQPLPGNDKIIHHRKRTYISVP